MDIEKRLRRLELTNRLLIALVLIALAGATTGYVKAARSPGTIVADSVVTHSLRVVNSYGKQGVEIAVGDDGMVGLDFTDSSGRQTLGLLSDPAGSPTICLDDQHTCRVAIGLIYRDNCPELNIQLRNKDGAPIWTPKIVNPFTPTATPQSIIDRCHLDSQVGSQK